MAPIPGIDSGRAARGQRLVLVAEDDVPMRTVLVRFISSLGYEVIEAADGCAVIAVARVRAPDIVLLDISMPGKDGVEVLKELSPVLPNTGFIMVTGNEDEGMALSCLWSGAFDYILKPVCMDYLALSIKTWLLLHVPGPR